MTHLKFGDLFPHFFVYLTTCQYPVSRYQEREKHSLGAWQDTGMDLWLLIIPRCCYLFQYRDGSVTGENHSLLPSQRSLLNLSIFTPASPRINMIPFYCRTLSAGPKPPSVSQWCTVVSRGTSHVLKNKSTHFHLLPFWNLLSSNN